MNKIKINKMAKKLINRYLSQDLEDELQSNAKFFTKPELIQPKDDATQESILALCQLSVDLQTARERVVVIYLDALKAKNRLRKLEKELQKQEKDNLAKVKNDKLRAIHMFSKCKAVENGISRAKYFCTVAEIVMSNIDKHVWVLRDNSKALQNMVRTDD